MRTDRGFTLIEIMIAVAIIAILAAVAIPTFSNLILKSQEGTTKGNLGSIRGALNIYYGDNEDIYPLDDLSSLTVSSKYLDATPAVNTPPYHTRNVGVTVEATPTDTGQWSYDNVDTSPGWGSVHVGCVHTDTAGNVWSTN